MFGESGEVWEGGEGKIKWKQDEEGMEERRNGCMCVTEKNKTKIKMKIRRDRVMTNASKT